jgi:hemoglobin
MRKALSAMMWVLIASPLAFGAQPVKGRPAKTPKKVEIAQSRPKEKENPTPTSGNSLYDRLGGKDVLKVIADEWIANVAADKSINKFFEKADLPAFKSLWVEQVCEASGGSCQFSGKGMKETYKEMGLKETDEKALMEDLERVFDKMKIDKPEKDELLKILVTIQGDSVEKK